MGSWRDRVVSWTTVKVEALAQRHGWKFVREDVQWQSVDVEIPTDHVAALIVRAGSALSNSSAVDEVLEIPTGRADLARDLMVIIQFLESRRVHRRWRSLKFLLVALRNFQYIFPGVGSKRIRTAYLKELDVTTDTACLNDVSISLFGATLAGAAYAISEKSDIPDQTFEILLADIDGIITEDLSEGKPVFVEWQIGRLQLLLDWEYRSSEANALLSAYALLAVTVLLAVFVSPWRKLVEHSSLLGLIELAPTLFVFLSCSCALCSLMVHHLWIGGINEYRVATVKTFAKATTLMLALATLALGAGISLKNQSSWDAVSIGAYIFILLSSLTADNLVAVAEARLSLLRR